MNLRAVQDQRLLPVGTDTAVVAMPS